MPSSDNQIDPTTRAEMALLDAQLDPQKMVDDYDNLVRLGAADPVALSTYMAHMSHAEVRIMFAFFLGQDVASYLGLGRTSPDTHPEES